MRKSLTMGALTVAAAAALSLSTGQAASAAQTALVDRDARVRYQSELQSCRAGTSTEAPETCVKEARAALQASEQGKLTQTSPDYASNRLARCNRLEGIDKDASVARVMGAGKVEGTVAGGGIYRELTVQYVVDPATGRAVATAMPPATTR